MSCICAIISYIAKPFTISMENKLGGGQIRNKERSKLKFLEAVGTILKTQGHAGLKINAIAATAGVDKKMIYTYFGGLDGLIDEFIRRQDFWSNVKNDQPIPPINDGGKAVAQQLLLQQFEYVLQNEGLQKLLLWRLSEERNSLRVWTDNQESNGEQLFKYVADPHFGDNAPQFRAIMAILISGLYYLDLYSMVNGSIFCGIDIKSEKGRSEIEKAIVFMVDQAYGKF